MRWTAKPDIVEFLAATLAGCVALAAVLAWPSGPARAGPITNVAPAPKDSSEFFGADKNHTGPFIQFGLSPNGLDASGPTGANPNATQQSVVPWIIQDQHSLDWFGKRDEVLSMEAEDTTVRVQPETPVIGVVTPQSSRQGGSGDSGQSRSGSSQGNEGLGAMLSATVTSVFAAFGYAKTAFILIPIIVLGLFVGAKQMARVLRASQGLDPDRGEHRWGIRRTGEFGPVNETNDNASRSKRPKDVA